jgi:hypothetical protein
MKEDARTAVKHEFEHAQPTVIHDPEQDMTILARWVHHGMQQGPKFWYLLAGGVVLILFASILIGSLSGGKTSVARAWSEIGTAQTPQQVLDVAEAYPNAEVGRAARLQAASAYFREATNDLPRNRDSALPKLKKALDLFLQVAKDAPHSSPEALAAAFDAARTYEARNELPEAIEQYKVVSSSWPGTAEAKQAEVLAAKLKDPEVVDFYKQLYAYKPPTASLPTGLEGIPGFPSLSGLPDNHPPLGGPAIPTPGLSGSDAVKNFFNTGPAPLPFDIPPPPPTPPSTTPRPADSKTSAPAVKKDELPADVFTPPAKPKS